MSSLLFSTKWRRLQLRGSRNYTFFLIVVIIFICCTQFCRGDTEPKPNYEDMSTPLAKPPDDGKLMNAAGGGVAPKTATKSSVPLSNLGFIHAFVASISVILVSELGDKTFFIAAIMAMRHPRVTVFVGAISALALMTVLSAVFGMAATIIPRVYTYYISTFLFAVFGLKMLKEGYYMKSTDAQEELEEVQSDLRKREDELMKTINGDIDRNPASNNRGSTTSVRIHRIKEDYDSDEDQIRAMLPTGGEVGSNANDKSNALVNGGPSSAGRRSVSAMNLSHIDNNSNNNRYSLDMNNVNSNLDGVVLHKSATSQSMTTGSATVLNKADLTSNGMMELKQFGSKKSLEKEASATSIQDPESGVIRRTKQRSAAYIASRIFMQAFTMTFLAEWGDRSQLTTIILSAREDVYGVIVGGVLGHSICTGLAVIGGRMIAQRISVRTVTLVGGVVFILFAISALFFNPNEE